MGARERDPVRRASGWLYARLGGRIAYLGVAGTLSVGALTLVVTGVWTGRYLRLSVSQVAVSIVVAISCMAPVALVVVRWSGVLRPIFVWSGARRTAARAPETWNAVIRLVYTHTPRFGLILGAAAGPPAIALVVLASGVSWWKAVGMFVAGFVGLLGLLVVVMGAGELALRPLLEDIASFLPVDFEPSARSWRLRTKALAPLPPLALYTALTVGAYVDLVGRGVARLFLAIGIGVATVAIAGAIYWVVAKSALDPVEDLLAATRRVGEGDIDTPVALVAADELGELAIGFNRMLSSLRAHERELEESRARIVSAADDARRRVERDLHDGAQQQLVVLNLKLGMMERLGATDPAKAVAMVGEVRDDLSRALGELRDLAHGIYPTVLESDGLPGALEDAVQRVAIPTRVESNGTGRYRSEIEAAVYFCCLEALQNASKHAGDGARATVRLAERDSELSFEVADDGLGFDIAAAPASSGLQNMRDRIGALGGSLGIESTPGAGTTVAGKIPVR